MRDEEDVGGTTEDEALAHAPHVYQYAPPKLVLRESEPGFVDHDENLVGAVQ